MERISKMIRGENDNTQEVAWKLSFRNDNIPLFKGDIQYIYHPGIWKEKIIDDNKYPIFIPEGVLKVISSSPEVILP
jgi:hypothetical protein